MHAACYPKGITFVHVSLYVVLILISGQKLGYVMTYVILRYYLTIKIFTFIVATRVVTEEEECIWLQTKLYPTVKYKPKVMSRKWGFVFNAAIHVIILGSVIVHRIPLVIL